MKQHDFMLKFFKDIEDYKENTKQYNKIKKDIQSSKIIVFKILELKNKLAPYTSSMKYVEDGYRYQWGKQVSTDNDNVGFDGLFEYNFYKDSIEIGRIGVIPQIHLSFYSDGTVKIRHTDLPTKNVDKNIDLSCYDTKDLVRLSATLDYALDNFEAFEEDCQKNILGRAERLSYNSSNNLSRIKNFADIIGVNRESRTPNKNY